MPVAGDQRYLVVKGSGAAGLGDKVRAVISAVLYAQLSGRRLYVDWNDTAYGDGRANYFDALFRMEGVETEEKRPLHGTVRPAAWQRKLHLNWDQLYAEFGSPPWNRTWAMQTFSFDQGVLDWPEEICVMWDFDQFRELAPLVPRLYPSIQAGDPMERMQGEILRRHLKPSAVVQEALQPYQKRLHALRPLVGVHVRASEESFRMRNAPPVRDYIKAVQMMIRRNGASGVLLATDNREVQESFVVQFGRDRVVWTDKWLPEAGVALHLANRCPDRLQSARDAVVDVLLLAAADYLVTMGNSSFSMLARLFSAAPEEHRVTLVWKAPFWRRVLGAGRRMARRVAVRG